MAASYGASLNVWLAYGAETPSASDANLEHWARNHNGKYNIEFNSISHVCSLVIELIKREPMFF